MYLVAALAEVQTKVSVLEAVAEGGVEAPDLLERLLAEEHRGRGHDAEAARLVHRRMACREAGVDVPGMEVLADHDASVLNCTIGEEELAANGRRVGVLLGVAYQRVEPAGLRENVVVQEHQVLA